MSKKIHSIYKDLYLKYGDNIASVKSRNQKQQYVRFKYLINCINFKKNESLLDVGCGLGDLAGYLKKNKIECNYLGIDFVDNFINTASKKYSKDQKTKFLKMDIEKDAFPKNYDWLLLSGLFNDKDKNSYKFMIKIITKMFKASKKGIVFNNLTKYVDYENKTLFYTYPDKIFRYCVTNLSRYIVLKTNYQTKKGTIPFEYTMAVYKK